MTRRRGRDEDGFIKWELGEMMLCIVGISGNIYLVAFEVIVIGFIF